METRVINPWTWQDRFAFVQAKEVVGANQVLYCAGQGSVDAEGNLLHEGDMRAQAMQAIDNMETVLQQSGYELGDIVRMTYWVTDVDAYFQEAAPAVGARLAEAGTRYASALLGISRLALPDMLVEIEATAVK
jgi:enamine deaminase RidA (YjgF/YER057c/UK114 family)